MEFGNFKLKSLIYPLIWIMIGYMGFRYYRSLAGSKSAIRKSILGLGFALYIFASIYGIGKHFLCSDINYGTRYIHKTDDSLSIVCISYECYGTTASHDYYKIKQITSYIRWVTKVNKESIDKTRWRQVGL